MQTNTIDLTRYQTTAAAVEAVKQLLLNNGYTVIQHSPDYFNYSKDDKFAYFQFSPRRLGGASISSSYIANKQCGTGCQYLGDLYKVTLANLAGALNFTFWDCNPKFYKDLPEFLASDYFVFGSKVYTAAGDRPALEYLKDYYIFISAGHAPTINKKHIQLFNGLYERRGAEKKAIFIVKAGGAVEVLNHNLNLFEDQAIMQGFINKLVGV